MTDILLVIIALSNAIITVGFVYFMYSIVYKRGPRPRRTSLPAGRNGHP